MCTFFFADVRLHSMSMNFPLHHGSFLVFCGVRFAKLSIRGRVGASVGFLPFRAKFGVRIGFCCGTVLNVYFELWSRVYSTTVSCNVDSFIFCGYIRIVGMLRGCFCYFGRI